jgi:hypothetical protein
MSRSVGKDLRFGSEFVVLVGRREPSSNEFVDLEAEQINFTGPFAIIAAECRQSSVDGRNLLAHDPKGLDIDTPESVESLPLDRRSQKRLVIVLAVKVHQSGTALP